MLKSLQYFLETTGDMDTEVSKGERSLIAWNKNGVCLLAEYREQTNDFTTIAVEATPEEVKAALAGSRLYKTGRYSAAHVVYDHYKRLGLRPSERLQICNHDHSMAEIGSAVIRYRKQ